MNYQYLIHAEQLEWLGAVWICMLAWCVLMGAFSLWLVVERHFEK